MLVAAALLALGIHPAARAQEPIKVGTVLPLKGKAQGLGQGMVDGLKAALDGETVGDRPVELISANDFYEPSKAAEETRHLLEQNIFAMIGNVGTPTALVTVPILAERGLPAVGFFTGAGFLRAPEATTVVNYRASYVQETRAMIDMALQAGLQPSEICAYVQNDGYGMAGLTGVKAALAGAGADSSILDPIDQILTMTGDNPPRNGVGPVGVYRRNTFFVRPGYRSLKEWEQRTGSRCRLIVTAGAYDNIAHFARNARKMKEPWVISAVSFTGADSLRRDAEKYGAAERIVMTQVVPLLNDDLAIVREARERLGDGFNFVSLEGYIVGRMWLKIMRDIKGELTTEGFLAQVKRSRFNLGGVPIDLTKDNQASDLVVLSRLTAQGFVRAGHDDIREMLAQ